MKLPTITEDQFIDQVLQLAKIWVWRRAHFRPARTAHGWRTPVQADGKGFLDLVLVRECVIYAECKSETGKLTPEQTAWKEALLRAGETVYVWRPSDWPEIERILENGP